MNDGTRISVIIPTLNEADNIAETIKRLQQNATVAPEIIVVDCGSSDSTVQIARQYEVDRLEINPKLAGCKYLALNRGAELANNGIMLFLDADSLPPAGYDQHIFTALKQPEVVGGAFEMEFDSESSRMKIIAMLNQFRYRFRKRFYGDQGIFVRKKYHQRVQGFPPMLLLEAAYYCKNLQTQGKLKLITNATVTTSARRFVANGIFQTFIHDMKIWLIDLLGMSTQKYGQQYWDSNRSATA